MTTARTSVARYDPYDIEINADPYPAFRQPRDQAQMPMRVIGMLLGIPEQDQEAIRNHADASLRTEAGQPMKTSIEDVLSGAMFADYIEWRSQHPSDDLMTELLLAEFEDETGTTRRLTREEILTYV